MTPAADRQRLKRQRRAEAGMMKVEVWLSADEASWVRKEAEARKWSLSELVAMCVRHRKSF